MALVFEDPLRRDVKPGLRGVLAQRRGLRPDRLVFLLPGAGDPGVDRRAGHGAAVPPGQAARRGPASVAPIWRRPLTTPWPRDGRRRTPPRPPGRSPGGGTPPGPPAPDPPPAPPTPAAAPAAAPPPPSGSAADLTRSACPPARPRRPPAMP